MYVGNKLIMFFAKKIVFLTLNFRCCIGYIYRNLPVTHWDAFSLHYMHSLNPVTVVVNKFRNQSSLIQSSQASVYKNRKVYTKTLGEFCVLTEAKTSYTRNSQNMAGTHNLAKWCGIPLITGLQRKRPDWRFDFRCHPSGLGENLSTVLDHLSCSTLLQQLLVTNTLIELIRIDASLSMHPDRKRVIHYVSA